MPDWKPRRRRLRQLLAGDKCVHPGSVYDALSARIAADIGFEVGMFAGSTASLAVLGAPGATIEDELDTVRLNVECAVDHPLCSIVQPYPELELNDITRGMGIAVAAYDDFPAQFNRGRV